MKEAFDSIPHSFVIMKKCALLIIAGYRVHFISYLVVNFGAHFREEDSTKVDSTFIANINSGVDQDNMEPFVQWLLAVIYKLEVWVMQFLRTSVSDLIESPFLVTIGRKCKSQI
jgi:hypothetical protein